MNGNGGRDASPLASPRLVASRRMHRSDSIPEHSETTTGPAVAANASIEELLMRHSSPIFNRSTGAAVTSPLAERNSSPSPLRMNRPRSNPRSRTPMRIPEQEEQEETAAGSTAAAATTEGCRITIRLGTGSGVGTNTASYGQRRIRQEHQPVRVRSSKQGPSHRKARRWNNDNFVNLAAELSAGKGSASAVEALLKGSAEASKHRSVFDPQQHESKAMKQFREDDSLSLVREKFFEGSLPCDGIHSSTASSKRKVVTDKDLLTPLERFHLIENRLRRIVVKACENSYAASKVVNTLEEFLIRVHNGEKDETPRNEWKEFLLEAPTVTAKTTGTNTNGKKQQQDNHGKQTIEASRGSSGTRVIIKFLFDSDSSTGGFHRLLLHGVCQFHCLHAASSTTRVEGKKARVLTATGTFSGANVRLVDFITERQEQRNNSDSIGAAGTGDSRLTSSPEEILPNKLSVLKV
mmetsp:Transcript_8366/g.19278  ORF Transcript_8366/g.19278 Transcript_8366/m.19278 type:complete len:465 (+) Transcript_8366:122-1516(+)|eukprot:CAMPEP_0201274588 /NCGR_PEP_ID=MMETSP0853-20130426/49589_1 /ASSEMBLY_ACC=CAM_ASM_000640 /TAXON_ID=183588 /ORGANISM="Pseudo-nitzschia fraudulenta, Strain WWA7" /LENGTH=464 /DNA_ID=CAMNT_0047581999 /DNA_START=15 /DNA_END=1409 /DNA_ORIENTATION=-